MNWPPVKAWTSKFPIEGQLHFVAINYGGKKTDRWVSLMSVIDSYLVIKISWLQLTDTSIWVCGWDETSDTSSLDQVKNNKEERTTKYANLSIDSGLTIPITNSIIRPWFSDK